MAFSPMNVGGGSLSETVLWTNSSPTSSFNAQEVTLSDDVNNYDYIKVTWRRSTTLSDTLSVMLSLEEWLKTDNTTGNCFLGMCSRISGLVYARRIYLVSNTSVGFRPADFIGGEHPTDNNRCIPYQIIGLK